MTKTSTTPRPDGTTRINVHRSSDGSSRKLTVETPPTPNPQAPVPSPTHDGTASR